ncbi:MAG TPA: hypothetical protein VIT65_07840 [Microlunatus sp.]
MSEPTGPGMGRPSGPGFHGPPATVTTPAGGPVPPSSGRVPTITPVSSGPPPSRTPAVLTWLAVAVVALVVAIASVVAAREDVRQATPRPEPPTVSNPTPAAQDRIEFTTNTGSGVLEIADHGWDSDGTDTDAPGSLLTVAVRISCTSGTLRYGPSSFQAFDRSGDLFDPVVMADSSTALDIGILSAGQQVTGTMAFDIPHGGVTLLMSDESSRTVTALRVPD